MRFLPIVFFVAFSWCSSYGAEIGKAVATAGKTTETKCGQSNLSVPKDKVIGAMAAIGNFPWQVTIFQKDSSSGKWRPSCGGTLISPRTVLTVAHCVVSVTSKDLNVALGKTNRDYYKTEHSEVKRAVKDIHIPELYRSTSSIHSDDIAALILEGDVDVSTIIMPVCLDIHPTHFGDITKGFVVSWGNPDTCTGDCTTQNSQLTYSQASLQDYKTCYQTANATNRGLALLITPDKFCADDVLYRGDSGAGLTFIFNNSQYLYGIASGRFSVKVDGKTRHRAVFTNVTYHMDWIKSKLS